MPVIHNRASNTDRNVLPLNFSLEAYFLVYNVVDRGSTGAALVNWILRSGYLWSVSWCYFHDLWNGVKHSAK